MKIYTRTGDDGDTALFGAGRVGKDELRVEAYGTVDELNSVMGWAIAEVETEGIRERLKLLQHDLFSIGSELATPPPEGERTRPQTPGIPIDRVDEMESWMDLADEELPPLRAFVLPGGARGAAALHVARTVCRRAERSAVRLSRESFVDPDGIRYLNRLSDLLFTLARLENHRVGAGDVEWQKPETSS